MLGYVKLDQIWIKLDNNRLLGQDRLGQVFIGQARLSQANEIINKLTDGRFIPDVLEEDVERLEELDANVTSALLVHDLQEERKHVPFQEKTGKK